MACNINTSECKEETKACVLGWEKLDKSNDVKMRISKETLNRVAFPDDTELDNDLGIMTLAKGEPVTPKTVSP